MALFYGSISFDQLSGYIVFCTVPIWGAKPPPYKSTTKYNVARKLAKRNGAIIYAKAGMANPTCSWPYSFERSKAEQRMHCGMPAFNCILHGQLAVTVPL